MPKLHINQTAGIFIIFILMISLTLSCSKDEKCYTCTGYQGTLRVTNENVCGDQMLEYQRNMGFKCTEVTSSSNKTSSILGPDELDKVEIDSLNNDCPCKNSE